MKKKKSPLVDASPDKRKIGERCSVAVGSAWACLWRSCNALDGERSHLVRENCVPVLYPTRQLMRNYIVHKFGYIASRPDLKAEPHGWKMPVPVRVTISPNVRDEQRAGTEK